MVVSTIHASFKDKNSSGAAVLGNVSLSVHLHGIIHVILYTSYVISTHNCDH